MFHVFVHDACLGSVSHSKCLSVCGVRLERYLISLSDAMRMILNVFELITAPQCWTSLLIWHLPGEWFEPSSIRVNCCRHLLTDLLVYDDIFVWNQLCVNKAFFIVTSYGFLPCQQRSLTTMQISVIFQGHPTRI